jgi:hypothetical protein
VRQVRALREEAAAAVRHAEAVERGAQTQEEALKSRLFIVEQDRVSNEKRLAMQAFFPSLSLFFVCWRMLTFLF